MFNKRPVLLVSINWQVKVNKIAIGLDKTWVKPLGQVTHVDKIKKNLGTCASNKISVNSVPCDPVRSNHRNHKCGECCRPDPKYTNSNLAMIFPEFSRKKAKNMEFSTTFLSRYQKKKK